MREIKFRAWHKIDQEMSEFSFTNNLVAVEDKDNLVICSDSGGWSFYDENLVIMRFSGLKDHRGIDIYEGDILRITPAIGYPGVVQWNQQHAKFECVHPGISTPSSLNSRDTCYVIGNFYEHPDRLMGHEIESYIPR
jgi:uncharacterized phage protein (TIGR01671 family)